MGLIPPWCDLPQELLSAIAECLRSNPIDILSFRSVCKSWYSSSISPSKLFSPLPLITPSPQYVLRNQSYFPTRELPHCILSVTVVYAIHPPIAEEFPSCMPRAFILFVDQSKPGKVSIRKPFSQISYSLPINFPRNLNLLTFKASELGRFYNLSNPLTEDAIFTRLSEWSGIVRKVVLFSNDKGLFLVGLSGDGRLSLLRLGLEDKDENLGAQTHWEIIHEGKGFRFDDIVDFKGRLLGIDRRGRVYNIELNSSNPIMMNVIVPPITGGGGRQKRLVESLGCLHLVVRSKVREEVDPMFKVYKLNEDTKKWVEVKSLGDRTFLLGLEFSLSVSAEELHGSCGKNWVLFKKNSFLNYNRYDDNDDNELFRSLKSTDLHIGVWRLEDDARLSVIGSHPDYAKVFWPPPTWIWPSDETERIGNLLSALGRLQVKIPDYEKLKAKLDGLSLRQHHFALTIIKSGIKMKETLNYAREIDEMLKQLKMFAASWQQQHKSENLHNQEGTSSTLENEESHVSASPFKMLHGASKQGSSNFDLHSMEMNLHAFILLLEEYTSKLEDVVNSYKFSASVAELIGIMGTIQ